jgi:YesN/AraC family two-component response regulator
LLLHCAVLEIWGWIFGSLTSGQERLEEGSTPAGGAMLPFNALTYHRSVERQMAKILIVDDDSSFREILKEFLNWKSPGTIIEEAVNAGETLKKVQTFCPDLILMDIRLPDESGLALTKRIKAGRSTIRIIMLTSFDIPEYRKAALLYRADGFLIKGSIKFEELLAMLNSFLPTSQAVTEAGQG